MRINLQARLDGLLGNLAISNRNPINREHKHVHVLTVL